MKTLNRKGFLASLVALMFTPKITHPKVKPDAINAEHDARDTDSNGNRLVWTKRGYGIAEHAAELRENNGIREIWWPPKQQWVPAADTEFPPKIS
jgi:hypothetical protein